MQKRIAAIYLLRKSRQDGQQSAPVLKPEDFPLKFAFGTKTYKVERTKNGKVIMTAE